MFEDKDSSFVKKLRYFYDLKRKSQNFKDIKQIIKYQEKLIKKIINSIEKKGIFLLKEYAQHSQSETVIERLSQLNNSQTNALINYFKYDFQEIKNNSISLRENLEKQLEISKNNLEIEVRKKYSEEDNLLLKLENLIGNEKELAKRLETNIKFAKKLEHKDWFQKILKNVAKVIVKGKFNIIVEGLENIPEGATLLACRHYHGDFDPSVIMEAIPRKLFFMGATDWMKNDIQRIISTKIFELQGVIPVHRPDAKEIHGNVDRKKSFDQIVALLCLKQSVVIFPEGWPIIDAHYTPRTDSGISKINEGVFKIAKFAQKIGKSEIPIVPIGLEYEDKKGIKNTVIVNIGKPMFINLKSFNTELPKYKNKIKKQLEQLSNVA